VLGLQPGFVDTEAGRHERPHKPLLVLTAIEMIEAGTATPEEVPWSADLWERFGALFERVRGHNDKCTPENPFRYLRTDGFWEGYKIQPGGGRTELEAPPLRGDAGMVFGRFTGVVAVALGQPGTRRILREAIIARFLPVLAKVSASGATEEEKQESALPDLMAAEETAGAELYSARSGLFRRKVVAEYDHQCAACGLRIKLPETSATFVEAAHLIPFSESHNDHPTNGIALCQNHHWAMDRQLIAPGPDHRWHVSAILDSRRSNGEAELRDLLGRSVLLPREVAYYPAEEALRWRVAAMLE